MTAVWSTPLPQPLQWLGLGASGLQAQPLQWLGRGARGLRGDLQAQPLQWLGRGEPR